MLTRRYSAAVDFAFGSIILSILLPFLVGLLFVLLAARLATRVVLDEIDKDRKRRGARSV